jgi:hypothetical protein
MALNKRVFAQTNPDNQQTEWYFVSREGVEGPFPNGEIAQSALERYIEFCLFDVNRVFSQHNTDSDKLEWYFVARDGIEGPYKSELIAQTALENYIAAKKKEREAKPE